MVVRKEFYFVRHGQTDHNYANLNSNQSENMPLNHIGRSQAHATLPIISKLPIRTICSSPLKRALETAKILSTGLEKDLQIIEDLAECSLHLWNEMTRFNNVSTLPFDGEIRSFINKVKKGIEQALTLPGPILIVAHGGIHWVLCCLLSIKQHEWVIGNCIPVHFTCNAELQWAAQRL